MQMEDKGEALNPDAMYSLLKEIDQEISHTDNISIDQLPEEDTLDNEKKIDASENVIENTEEEALQLGDESANTTTEIKETSCTEDHDTVENTEDVISMAEGLDKAPLETAWIKHNYQQTKPVVSKRLISNDGSDTSVEDINASTRIPSYTSEEITGLELKDKMVTDVGERLSHFLDQKYAENPNLPALKGMLSMADEKAMEDDPKKDKPLVFTIEPTKPLFPSKEVSSTMIQVEIHTPDEDDVDGAAADTKEATNLLLDSKIPVTPNVCINRFVNNNGETRVSSGSSTEDAQELNTHRFQDRYHLLSGAQAVPQLPQLPALTLQDYKSSSVQSVNASRIFSVATTNDNYQSAKEYDLSSTVGCEELSDDASVKDLEIPEPNELPCFPTFQLDSTSMKTSSSMETVQHDKAKFNSDVNIADDTMEQIEQEEAELISNPERSGSPTNDNMSQHSQNRQLLGVSEVSQAQQAPEHHVEMSVEFQDEGRRDITSSFSRESDRIELPPLPPMNGLSTMFDQDLFNDHETSHESIDLTSSSHKENYLSIWHSQKTGGSFISPALSTNSQFSTQSRTSSVPTNHSGSSFKFKSRIISNSHVFKQEAFRQFSDEYVLSTQDDSKLDPLRRNTIMSKRIQQELKTQAKMYPFANKFALDESSELSIHNESIITGDISRTSDKAVDTTNILSHKNLTLLPPQSTETVFSSFLDNFDKDDFEEKLAEESRLNSKKNLQTTWGHFRDVSSGNVDIKATQQQIAEVLHNQNEDVVQVGSHIQDVKVLLGNEIEGYDVQKSVSDLSVETTKKSPIKHVGSPFKVKARSETPPQSPVVYERDTTEVNEGLQRAPTTSLASVYLENSLQEFESSELQDHGKLYLKLKSINSLRLQQIKRHNAKYCIEFDNGKEVIETPWESIPEDGPIKMSQEFEVNMESNNVTLFMTMKIRYTSPQNQLTEVVEKIPIKKRFAFGKTKYRLEKRFVTKKLKYDDWDFKFAKDGSFARCQVNVNKNMLKQIKYKTNELHFEFLNEWEREFDEKIAQTYKEDELWKLPRKNPSKVCSLTVDVMYLPRTSSMERFPKNLKAVQKCCEKYLEQQRVNNEGFLWQEGGDVEGMLKRRYMILKGTELIAHDEVTRKPQTLLNLLNVVDIYSDGKTATGKQMRNFTDMVLFSDCFKLLFANDEVINFNADSNLLKQQWVEILTSVVELNKFHQPWIKRVFENEQYNITF